MNEHHGGNENASKILVGKPRRKKLLGRPCSPLFLF
jgi:hypothetical protein